MEDSTDAKPTTPLDSASAAAAAASAPLSPSSSTTAGPLPPADPIQLGRSEPPEDPDEEEEVQFPTQEELDKHWRELQELQPLMLEWTDKVRGFCFFLLDFPSFFFGGEVPRALSALCSALRQSPLTSVFTARKDFPEIAARLDDFMRNHAGKELRFPAGMSPKNRRAVHELAEQRGLFHVARGPHRARVREDCAKVVGISRSCGTHRFALSLSPAVISMSSCGRLRVVQRR